MFGHEKRQCLFCLTRGFFKIEITLERIMIPLLHKSNHKTFSRFSEKNFFKFQITSILHRSILCECRKHILEGNGSNQPRRASKYNIRPTPWDSDRRKLPPVLMADRSVFKKKNSSDFRLPLYYPSILCECRTRRKWVKSATKGIKMQHQTYSAGFGPAEIAAGSDG